MVADCCAPVVLVEEAVMVLEYVRVTVMVVLAVGGAEVEVVSMKVTLCRKGVR